MLNWLCAHASGGGTREGLATDMHEKGRTIDLYLFQIVTRYVHAMNLMIFSLCEKCFGSGGTSSRNAIQLLCACFALQK